MPPCQSVLKLHLDRSMLIAYLWRQSKSAIIDLPDITLFGWFANGEITRTGDIYPIELDDIFHLSPEVEEEDELDDEYHTDEDSDDDDNES